MINLQKFTDKAITAAQKANIKGGRLRYVTTSKDEYLAKRSELKSQKISYDSSRHTDEVTGDRVYCIEW